MTHGLYNTEGNEFTDALIDHIEKNQLIMTTEKRIEAMKAIEANYLKAFNSEVFRMKLELEIFDEEGEPETIVFEFHKPYGDIPADMADIPGNVKRFIQDCCITAIHKRCMLESKTEVELLKSAWCFGNSQK